MTLSHKHGPGNLDLSRLTLASAAVWLAVTCLVISNMTPDAAATATAGTARARGAASAMIADTDAFSAANISADLPSDLPVTPAADERTTSVETVVAAVTGDELAANAPPPARKVALAAANAPGDAGPFAFSADDVGKMLAIKLVPPSRFDVWAVPFVKEPKAWHPKRLDPLPKGIAPLTRTFIPAASISNPAPAREGLSLYPLDRPELPREIALSVPTPIVVHPQPLTFVHSPDPDQVPRLAITAAPPKEKLDPASNPARSSAEISLFQARLMPVVLPTGFLKLIIPDPFEQIRAVKLNYVLPDLDPAVFPAGRPSRAEFPVIVLPTEPKK